MLCVSLCVAGLAHAQEPFTISDDKFIDRSIPDRYASDVAIKASGDGWDISPPPGKKTWKLAMYENQQVLWSHGSTHTWIGKSKVFGYIFDSDPDNPLQFRVDKQKGYVYVQGRGTITTPDGKVVRLPEASGKK